MYITFIHDWCMRLGPLSGGLWLCFGSWSPSLQIPSSCTPGLVELISPYVDVALPLAAWWTARADFWLALLLRSDHELVVLPPQVGPMMSLARVTQRAGVCMMVAARGVALARYGGRHFTRGEA